jgi:hypothetical protein
VNGTELENRLAALLGVDDVRLARLKSRVLEMSPRPRARLERAHIAALLAVVCLGAAFFFGTRMGGPARSVVIETPRQREPQWTVRIQRVAESDASHYAPPPFGSAAFESDWIVRGRVQEVTRGEVRFAVEELLAGEGIADALALSRAFDKVPVSCRLDARWNAGEELVLALFRDPEDGHVKVREGGSGQARFPLEGGVTLEDLRHVLAGRPYDAARLAAKIDAAGPRCIPMLRHHLSDLLASALPLRSEPVQNALRRQLLREGDDERTWSLRRGALAHLEPERLAAIEPRIRAALAADLGERWRGRPSLHARAGMIEPFARAGFPFARPYLDELLAVLDREMAKKPRAYGYRNLELRLLPLLHRYDAQRALERAWALYRVRPVRGQADAGEALELLLRFQAEGATGELIHRTREQMRLGKHFVWLDLLVMSRDPEVRGLLRTLLARREWNIGFTRFDHSALRALEREGVSDHLDDLYAALIERLRWTDGNLSSYHHTLRIYLLRWKDVAPFSSTLAERLRGIRGRDVHTLQFARTLEGVLSHRFLPFRQPTEEELRTAAREMARVLERSK